MPRLNRHGWIISQLGISWLNDETEIGQRDIGGDVYRICTRPHGGTWSTHPVNRSCNALAAQDDHWLAWEAGRGVFGSTQLTDNPVYGFPHGGDGRGAASVTDGTIALAANNSNVGLILRRADATELQVPDAWLTDKISVLDRDRAIWVDSRDGKIRTLNLPPCQQLPGSVEFPTVLELQGEFWICYQNTTDVSRTVLHPFHSLEGYELPPGYYIHAVALDAHVARVVWAHDPAESRFDFRDIDTRTPRTNLEQPIEPAEPIVPIGRTMWMGWHTGTPTSTGGWVTNIYPASVPGNAYASILGAPEPHALIYDFAAKPIAVYTEGAVEGDINSIEERIADARTTHPGLPVMIYWPQAAWHTVPSAEWCGVEAYWGKDESKETFVTRVLGAIDKAKQAGRLTVPIFHCFTSNIGLQQDLTKIPPLASQLARDHLSIDHLWVFNGTGRATGLQDHPEVRPLWEEVFAGITGPPAGGGGGGSVEPPGVVNGVLVDPEMYWREVIVKGEDPVQYIEVYARKAADWYRYKQGYQNRSNCQHSSRLFLTHAGCRDVAPNPNDPHEMCLGVKQVPEAWECTVDTVENWPGTTNPKAWLWHNQQGIYMPPEESVEPPEPVEPPVEPTGGILIHHCDQVAHRGDPSGHLVRYEVLAGAAVTKLELKLIEDNEPAVPVMFSDKPGQDGHYIRGIAWKPVRNGTYRLRLRAWDTNGTAYENADPKPEVTVTE